MAPAFKFSGTALRTRRISHLFLSMPEYPSFISMLQFCGDICICCNSLKLMRIIELVLEKQQMKPKKRPLKGAVLINSLVNDHSFNS